MRKMLVGCISALGIFGVILSSDAMLVKDDRSGVQSPGTLVPIARSNVVLPVQSGEWERLSSDWSILHTAFFRALSRGEREGFDELLFSLPQHSLCRFIGVHILLEFLDSPDRPKLEKNSFKEFFIETRNLINPQKFYCGMRVGEEGINEEELLNLVLAEIGRWVPEGLRGSIWSDYVKACMNTRMKEEEWKQKKLNTLIQEERLKQETLNTQIEAEKLKQSKIMCDRRRVETEAMANATMLQVEILKNVQELEKGEQKLETERVDLNRKKLKLRNEVRESEWREEHPVADRFLGVVEKVAPPIAEKIGDKIVASTNKQ